MNAKNWVKAMLIAVTLSGLVVACDKDDDDDNDNNSVSLSGTASGANEIPPVTTAATATITGILNLSAKSLTYTINWNGLSGNATGIHFHGPATSTQNAGVLFPLTITTNGTTGVAAGTITNIADTTIAHFQNGRIYYNIHTANNVNGEIRAQVMTQ